MHRIHTTDDAIESEIQAKGKTAPRVTPADIEVNIIDEHYFTASDGVLGSIYAASEDGDIGDAGAPVSLSLLTFCVLTLANGFTVTGESACASPQNFDAEIGRKIARENAVQKVWPLMGYVLKQRLHEVSEKERKAAEAQANRPNQNCVFNYCPDEAACRAHGCQMGAPA
jgi:hypothetical protein